MKLPPSTFAVIFLIGLSVQSATGQLSIQSSKRDSEAGLSRTDRVLESVEVIFGEKSITYNRIESPTLQPLDVTAQIPRRAQLPPRSGSSVQLRELPRDISLLLSCVNYSNGVTKVSFPLEGATISFWSTTSFEYLAPLEHFHGEGASYTVIPTFVDYSEALVKARTPGIRELIRSLDIAPSRAELRHASRLSAVARPWVPIQPVQYPERVAQIIDDLHHFYHQNIEVLSSRHSLREQARAVAAVRERDRKLQQKSTSVNFFPIRSNRQSAPLGPGSTRSVEFPSNEK